MNLVRWDPFRELEDMNDRLNRMFGRSVTGQGDGREAMTLADWTPAVDVSESDNEYVIKADLPHVKKDDVKVTVQEGILSIQGERKKEEEKKGEKIHRVERAYGRFVRTFSLPDYVDESKVSADFKDGVLIVHLPKSEKAKPKAIEVKVS